ncbi:MAG: prepilin peptidase [Pseudomonadota bacterium]
MEGDITAYLSFSHILKTFSPDLVTVFVLSIILIPSAMADLREKKVPNFFSMSGWIVGPVMHFMFSGVDGLLQSGLGFALLFSLTFPLWLLKWFGAADVKLIASVGAIVGGFQALTVLLGIALTGFVMSLAIVVLHGGFFALLRALYLRLKSLYFRFVWRVDVKLYEPGLTDFTREKTIPYAVPIAFGTLLTILYIHV